MKCRSYIKHARFRFATTSSQFTPKQLAAFYGFPAGFTGAGIKVAIIELGGGYVQKDLDTYFHGLGLPNVKPVVFHRNGSAHRLETSSRTARYGSPSRQSNSPRSDRHQPYDCCNGGFCYHS